MEAPLRLLLVYPSCNLDVNPSLACLLEQFSARGAAVDVVMEEPGEFSTPVRHGPGVRFHPYPPGHVSLRGVRVRDLPLRLLRWVRRPGSGPQYRVWNDLAFFSATRAARYDAILGVDPGGIATAALLNRQARRPLLYLSYELLFRCELASPEEEAIKQAELAACRQVTLALIQDEERAALLAAETGLPRERMVLSPVAPAPTPRPASAYLRDRLAIPQDARTVLYLGQSSAWTGRDEMAEMVASWPERYVLVLHSSSRLPARVAPALRELIQARRVFLSREPIPRAELLPLVASADFGLAPYRAVGDAWETGLNVQHLGLASGKVSYYALAGLPMLARRLPVYEREFSRYDCGRIYQSPQETGRLLEELSGRYDHHAREARRFYEERLNPLPGLREFCDRTEQIIRRSREEARRRVGTLFQPAPGAEG